MPEIERKFLVGEPPAELDRFPHAEIRQGYLAVDEDGTEVRVRSRDGQAVLTAKQGAGRTRAEEELEIPPERFEALWALTEGRRVEKTRYLVPAGDAGAAGAAGGPIELDVYGGPLSGLVVAEVEFPDERAADAFEPPPWFGREVTDDPRFKNQRLARQGLPEPR
jgi:CYTH domain-containing protein